MKYQNGEFSANGWTKMLKRWTKGEHDRVYINNCNGKSCGYLDLKTKEMHWASNSWACMEGSAEFVNAILAMEF